MSKTEMVTGDRVRQQPERQVQRAVKELFERVGGRVWVLGTTRGKEDAHKGTRQTPGLGDLWITLPSPICCKIHGRPAALWFECKAEGGRMSAAQGDFQFWCVATRTTYLVGGLDEAVDFLVDGGWLKG